MINRCSLHVLSRLITAIIMGLGAVPQVSMSTDVNPENYMYSPSDTGDERLTFTLLADVDIHNEDEGTATVTVTAQLNSGSRYNTEQTLTITVSGSGTLTAVDFEPVSNFNIVVAANANAGMATFTLTPINDNVDEVNETITIASTSSLVTSSATIQLQDDDFPPRGVNLRASGNAVYEDLGAQEIVIFAEVSGTTTYAEDLVIPLTVTGTQQENMVGFTPIPNFSITLPAGTSTASLAITITPTNNAVDELNGQMTIASSEPKVTGPIIINLIDDDQTPSIILSAAPSSISESSGPVQITISANWEVASVFATDQIIPLSISGSGITSAVDYTSVSTTNLTIRKGASSGTLLFTLTPTNDSEDEVDEVITVSSSHDLVSRTATITLEDDDDPPENIQLAATPSVIIEGDGETAITVTATIGNRTTFSELTSITIDVAGSGTENTVQFSSVSSFLINFDPGESASTATLTITPVEDNQSTENEQITLSSTNLSVTGSAVIRLLDNDSEPTILLSTDPNSVLENAGGTTITVTATLQGAQTLPEAQTIPLAVTGTEKKEAVNFMSIPDFDLIVNAGTSSGTTTFILTPIDNTLDESDEILTVASTHRLVDNSPIIVLADDDETPEIRITAVPNSIAENDGETNIVVTATLIGSTQFATEQVLPLTVSGSGRDEAVDFAPVSSFIITIPEGRSNGASTFILQPEDDTENEVDESVTIQSNSPLVTGNAIVTILDDDHPGQIQLSVNPASIYEERGLQKITVTGKIGNGVAFNQNHNILLLVRGSGEPAAVDFEPVPNTNLMFLSGQLSATVIIEISPIDDKEFESDETLTLSSTDPDVQGEISIQLVNDDEKPTGIALSVSPERIREDAGATQVTVIATVQGATRYGTRQVLALDITGDSGPHTVGFRSASELVLTVEVGAPQSQATFEIIPEDNNIHQPNGTVTIGSNSDLILETVHIVLENDDNAPTGITLSAQPGSISESDGATRVTIDATLQGSTTYITEQVLHITAQGSGGTAVVKFSSIPDFVITIPAKSSHGSTVIEITPDDNLRDEQNEIITFDSENPLITQSGTLTILDDDPAPTGIFLSLNPMVVAEDAGATEITATIRVTGGTQYAIEKTFSLTGIGSGLPDAVDFTLTIPPSLSLPEGQEAVSTTFLIEPANDLLDEQNETLTITVRGDGLTSSAKLSLTDDDVEPDGFLLSASPSVLTEEDGPTAITVTASVAGDTRYVAPQILMLSVSTPIRGEVGFNNIADFTIQVNAGAESGSSNFILTPLQNTLPEKDATITITALHSGVPITTTLLIRDDDQSTERISDVNTIILPEATRAIIASSVGAVNKRIQGRFSNQLSNVAMRLRSNSPHQPSASQFNNASLATSIWEQITIWTHADYRTLSGKERFLDFNGGITGLHAGMDLSFGEFLAGVAVSHFRIKMDYEHRGISRQPNLIAPINGLYHINALTFSPYINWRWNPRSNAWAMVSFNSGEVEVDDPETIAEKTNSSLQSFAAGADFQIIAAPDGFSLAVKGAAWGGQMNLDQNISRIRGLDVGVYRFQVSLEGAYRIQLSKQAMLKPFLETGIRGDGGDGQTGAGMEIGGGAQLSLPSAGLQIAGHGHALVLHGTNVDEWGFGGMLAYAPGDGVGPTLELHSSTGDRSRNQPEIWQDTRRKNRHSLAQTRLGYGFTLNNQSVTPYAGIEMGHRTTTQVVGADYRVGSHLDIRLEGAHPIVSEGYENSPTLRAMIVLR